MGFLLRGQRRLDRLTINDLDTIVNGENLRYLPLLRLLDALKVPVKEEIQSYTFAPEGVGTVVLNLKEKALTINSQTRPIVFLQATSLITLKPDIFLRVADIAEILDMDLVWDNSLYEYHVDIDRKLSIWKRASATADFRKIKALYVPANLPELLGPAQCSESIVQFVENNFRPRWNFRPDAQEAAPTHIVNIPGPRTTLYGAAAKSQYKLDFSLRSGLWDNQESWQWNDPDDSVITINRAEMLWRLDNAEIALGDSTVGIGELIFPVTDIFGVRINGLVGFSLDELEDDISEMGINSYFNKPYDFEGTAPVGATVELYLNDRVIATEEVLPEEDLPPGFGSYLFEDIRLPGGILNEIEILITDLNGQQTRLQKNIIGGPSLLPKGKAAYLAAAGTRRDLGIATSSGVEIGKTLGRITAGRFLYGLTDRLTVGTMLAWQDDYHRPESQEVSDLRPRALPESSSHAGGMFSFLPIDKVLISGDLALSRGEGESEYDDFAFRSTVEYMPRRDLTFKADYLNFGSDYFDGQNSDARDRRAGAVGAIWRLGRLGNLEGYLGHVKNNLDNELDETLQADYQSLILRSSVVPKTSVTVEFDRLVPNWDSGQKNLTTIKVRSTPRRDLDIFGQISTGNDLAEDSRRELFSGLKLPGLIDFDSPAQYWTVRKQLPRNNSLAFTYSQTGGAEELILTHDVSVKVGNSLRLRTEAVKDLSTDVGAEQYAYRHRADYFLDERGNNRVGFECEYEDREWELMFYVSLRDLFACHEGRLVRADTRRVRTTAGAVNGVVFVDINANGVRDSQEPPLEGVTVRMGKVSAAVTDRQGYYILPAPYSTRQVRVFLDLESVPAVYSVTHGTQRANILPGCLTEVNLGVTPLISVSGRVIAEIAGEDSRNVAGLRMVLTEVESGKFGGDSVTARDGSFYIGDIRPGRYRLAVDKNTLSSDYIIDEHERVIEVMPTEEFEEMVVDDFRAQLR